MQYFLKSKNSFTPKNIPPKKTDKKQGSKLLTKHLTHTNQHYTTQPNYTALTIKLKVHHHHFTPSTQHLPVALLSHKSHTTSPMFSNQKQPSTLKHQSSTNTSHSPILSSFYPSLTNLLIHQNSFHWTTDSLARSSAAFPIPSSLVSVG